SSKLLMSPRTTLVPFTSLFRSGARDAGADHAPRRSARAGAPARRGVEPCEPRGHLRAGAVHAGIRLVHQRPRSIESAGRPVPDRSEETRLNSSHVKISYAVICL